jgi:putative peptidoglycan lipid II flippase
MTDASKRTRAALGRDVRTVSGLTLVSRVTGLVRDLVTVRIFGDGAVGSAFAAAFAIPNMFRRLFGEGAISAAFIPEYSRLTRDDRVKADAFCSLTVGLVAVITGLITIAVEIGLAAVLLVASPDPGRTYSITLVMFLLPYMPLVCVAAMLAGMLQVHGRFAPGASMPIILNFCILAAATPFFMVADADAQQWAWIIGGSVLVSGGLQIGWSVLALRGVVRWTTGVRAASDSTRTMLLRLGPVLLGLGTLQLNALIDTLIAMWPNWVGATIGGRAYPLDEAANSILFFTQRLYQFPLGVFGIAVATAIFPSLSRAADEPGRFVELLRHGVRLSLFIALPATVGLVLVRTDLIMVLYSGPGGGFSEDGITRSSAVLFGYGAGVWAYSLNQLWTRAFYARGNTATPMRVALLMVLLNLVLNLVLVFGTPLREAGLAWSTAVAAIVQCAVLGVLLNRREGVGIFDRATGLGVGRSVVLTAVMALAVGAVYLLMGQPSDWAGHAVRLGVLVGVGGAVYAVAARAVRCEELGWLLHRSGGNL